MRFRGLSGMPTWLGLALLGLACGTLNASPVYFKGYNFDAYVTRPNSMRYREFPKNGQSRILVQPDEEYSIVVRNPLPVRVAVAVTIDGLNSIDGKRTTTKNARKWIIEPNSTITINGWQTSGQTLRKFVFTRQGDSYAQWQQDRTGKPLSRNLGVIGVAWFWNSAELEAALHPAQPFESDNMAMLSRKAKSGASAQPAAAAAEDRAGTGMGRQERNEVSEVDFKADAGMFSVRDVLKIYYEFAKEPMEPQPFVSDREENERFAPEMAK